MGKSFFGPTNSFFLYLILASIIAVCGFVANSNTMLVGSMLLAPFFTPIITTNQFDFTQSTLTRSLTLLLFGIIVAAGIGYVATIWWGIDKETKEMKDRAEWNQISNQTTKVNYIIPFITGVAVAIAYETSDIIPMVGAGIAISILPPIVNAGMYLGQVNIEKAKNSLKLGLINLFIGAASYTLVRQLFLDQIKEFYYKGTILQFLKNKIQKSKK